MSATRATRPKHPTTLEAGKSQDVAKALVSHTPVTGRWAVQPRGFCLLLCVSLMVKSCSSWERTAKVAGLLSTTAPKRRP